MVRSGKFKEKKGNGRQGLGDLHVLAPVGRNGGKTILRTKSRKNVTIFP